MQSPQIAPGVRGRAHVEIPTGSESDARFFAVSSSKNPLESDKDDIMAMREPIIMEPPRAACHQHCAGSEPPAMSNGIRTLPAGLYDGVPFTA